MDDGNIVGRGGIPKRLEKDGVIYVPSGEGSVEPVVSERGTVYEFPKSMTQKNGAMRPETAPVAPKRRLRPQRSQLMLFYVLTLIVGVVICVAVFGIVLNHFRDGQPPRTAQVGVPEPPGGAALGGFSMAEIIEITGVISDVDMAERRLRVMDAATGQTIVLNAMPETVFLNRNRNEISLSSFSVGNVVDVRYDADTHGALSVQISQNGWEHRMISSVHVHPDRRSINIGASNYSYDESTIVLYRNYRFDIEQINPIDVVTVSGFRSRVLFVEVNRSHGIVRFTNADEVRNGTIEINTSIFRQLSDTNEIRLLEGAHRIVIRGDNIEPMVREIVLANAQTIDIDLSGAQYRTGLLTVNVDADEYRLEINGRERPGGGQPVVVGLEEEITVSVTRSGFVPFLQVIEMTEPTMVLEVELSPLQEMAVLVLNTIPAGSSVVINDRAVGATPVSELVPFGRHNVVIRMEGFEVWTMQFDVNEPRQEYQIMLTPVSAFPTATPTPLNTPGVQGANPAQTPTPSLATPTPMPFPTAEPTPMPLPTPRPFPTPVPAVTPFAESTPAPVPTPEAAQRFPWLTAPAADPPPVQGATAGNASGFNFSQVDEFRNE